MQPECAPGVPLRREWWIPVLLFGAALFCYGPALSGALLWDDAGHVTKPELQSWSGLGRIWFEPGATQQYYPVLHTAFWIEHHLWGDATLGYHLLNVLLHALSAWLLVGVLRQLKVPGALLAGFLFAVHPVCVESVAWISEQKNTLSLCFYLLAAGAYLRFEATRQSKTWLFASSLFLLALLSKSVTATLPAALLLVLWWQRGSLGWRRDVRPLLPWFGAAIAGGLFTEWIERTYIGAHGSEFSLSGVQRVLLAAHVIWFYLGKLIWPADLIFIYPHWSVPSEANGWIGDLAAVVVITAVLVWWSRRSRGPMAAWLFFVGSLFPALGFFDVYPFVFSYVADHFQYLACLGVFTAVAAGTATLVLRIPRPVRPVAWGCIVLPLAALAAKSHRQSQDYVDVRTLYGATIARNPGCWMAHYNLGLLLADDGRTTDALGEFRAAVAAKPDFADAYDDLANALAKTPDGLDDAVAEYQVALRLKPNFAEARDNLGNALARIPGRLPDAIEQYRSALRLKPDFAEAHNNLAFQLEKMPGRLPEALAEYETALRLKPDYPEARYNFANVLASLPGRLPDAIIQYEAALRLSPNTPDIRNNLAVAYANAGRLDDAIAQEEAALQLNPAFASARRNLDRLRMLRGH